MATGGISGGSTIDVQTLASQLVAAERLPLDQQIKRAQTSVTTNLSALGALKSALSTFETAVQALSGAGDFAVRSAKSSDETVFKATAESNAVAGAYDIEVVQLAAAHQIASGPHAGGSASEVGTGTLTLSLGGESFSVEIDSTNSTLAGIRDAINRADGNTGISATIVQSAEGARLVLSSRETGAASTIEISTAGGDGGLASLAYSSAAPGDYTELTAAADAIVNVAGFQQTSSTNTIDGAIDGVKLTLAAAKPGETLRLTVEQDTSTVKARINSFVNSYNAMQATIKALRSYDPVTQTGGPLLGDALLQNVESQMRRALSDAVTGLGGNYTSLASIGITTAVDGKLELDTARLDTALAADFDGVAALFSGDNGVAKRLDGTLGRALASDGGIAARTTALTNQQRTLVERQENVDTRMQAVLANYVRQFTTLDTLLSTLNTTSSFLDTQLESLRNLTIKRD